MSELLKLRSKDIDPPCGWTYTLQSKDGKSTVTITEGSFGSLLKSVVRYLAINNREVNTAIAAVIEDDICRRSPANFLLNPPVNHKAINTRWTQIGIKKVADKTLTAWRATGRKHNPALIAIERATLCKTCELNRRTGGCSNCNSIIDWATQWIGRHAPMEHSLAICRADGMVNSVGVMLTDHTIRSINLKTDLSRYSEQCWKRTILGENNDRPQD